MDYTIEKGYALVISFPTSHCISDWKPVMKTQHLLIIIKTDNGIIGVGEGTPYQTNVIDDYRTAVKLLNLIKGYSLDEAQRLIVHLGSSLFKKKRKYNYGTFLAIESAILDAIGKARKTRVAELLGNIHRTKIPVCGTIFLKHPKKMAEEANIWLRKGVKHLKVKIPCNLEELEHVLKTLVKSIHVDDSIVLRVDANECFKTVDKAIKALRIMERYRVNIVEQPLPRDNVMGLRLLRKLFSPSLKIMVDESLKKPNDVEVLAHEEVADIVNFHPSKLGCLTITRSTMLRAKKLGLEVQIGSSLMTEVGLSQYLHLAASLPSLDYPLEEVGLYEFYGYAITTNPYTIINGSIALPQSIGLGVKLELQLVKRYLISGISWICHSVSRSAYRLTDLLS